MRNFAVVLVLALAAAPAMAQEHEHHMATEGETAQGEHCALMMMGGAPLMGAMHAGPHAVLMQSETLSLTAEQTSQLEALQARMHEDVHGHMEAARAAQVAATQLEGAAHEARLREAADHVVQAQLAATEVAAATRQILTSEQQAELAEGHGMMGGMQHEGMQHEGMQHEGMQHGGMMGMMQQCMSMHGGGH